MNNTPRQAAAETVNEFKQSAKNLLLPPGVPATTQIYNAPARKGHVWRAGSK